MGWRLAILGEATSVLQVRGWSVSMEESDLKSHQNAKWPLA